VVHTLWSVKGGSGVTVTSAVLAAASARRVRRVVLVDLCGDQPAALGVAEPHGPGLTDWLASDDGSAAALGRLMHETAGGIWLLPRGHREQWSATRVDELVAVLAGSDCPVVVDAGVLAGPGLDRLPTVDLGRRLAAAGRSTLVTRPCYLSLRRYQEHARSGSSAPTPQGLIVVEDTTRPLTAADVSALVELPVLATVSVDAAIARSVDAGTLVRRRHRPMERELRGAA
jgi:hypothetical protein